MNPKLQKQNRYDSVEPIILSVDEKTEVCIRDVAYMIANAMEFKGEVIFDSSKSDGQHKKTACNTKLRSFKPDYEFTPIEDGIKKACDWFVENYGTKARGTVPKQ